MLSDSRLLVRAQASESALKAQAGRYHWLHFATHGVFDADRPLSSGLLLAPDSSNDGTLTVDEIYDLSLTADLVTLSACESGLGQVSNGDDVVALARGFLYAGAHSIVGSLWPVDDQATARLMEGFYRRLEQSDKHEALRFAQLQVRDGYNAHPYYWASFQITGAVR